MLSVLIGLPSESKWHNFKTCSFNLSDLFCVPQIGQMNACLEDGSKASGFLPDKERFPPCDIFVNDFLLMQVLVVSRLVSVSTPLMMMSYSVDDDECEYSVSSLMNDDSLDSGIDEKKN